MTEHFGTEFGLSKDEVITIISNYDYLNSIQANSDDFGAAK